MRGHLRKRVELRKAKRARREKSIGRITPKPDLRLARKRKFRILKRARTILAGRRRFFYAISRVIHERVKALTFNRFGWLQRAATVCSAFFHRDVRASIKRRRLTRSLKLTRYFSKFNVVALRLIKGFNTCMSATRFT